MQQTCICRPVLIIESWSSNEVETENTQNLTFCIWRVPTGKKQSGPHRNGNGVGPARSLAHQRRVAGRLGLIHDVVPTARETANLFPMVLGQTCLIWTGHHQQQWRDQKETTLMTMHLTVKIHQSEHDIDRHRIRQTQQLTSNSAGKHDARDATLCWPIRVEHKKRTVLHCESTQACQMYHNERESSGRCAYSGKSVRWLQCLTVGTGARLGGAPAHSESETIRQ